MSNKILVISNYFPPEKGAASNRIFNMVNSIQKLDGATVDVLCPIPNYPEGKIFEGYRGKLFLKEIISDINVFRIWTYASNSKNALLRLISMVSFGLGIWLLLPKFLFSKYDKVVIQSPPIISAYFASVLFKLLGVKIYLNISDLWPLSALELGVIKRGKFYTILEWIERKMYSNADYFICQSQEIISHIDKFNDTPKLLYRNLTKEEVEISGEEQSKSEKIKLFYAGLIGVAQGILDICKNIDFAKHNIEFHVYGMGNEAEALEEFLKENPNRGIYFHGSLSRDMLVKEFYKYDLSLIPLKNRIYGAVPSKLYEMINYNIPVIFMGGGEGASIVESNKIGITIEPNDFLNLNKALKNITVQQITSYRENIENNKGLFSYNMQEEKLLMFIN